MPVDELVRGPGGAEHAPPRAGRRGRGHHPLQRRDHHGLPEADPGADGGELGDPAAEPAHPALLAGLRRRRRGRRAAGRGAERGGGGGRGRRRAAHHRSGRGHGVVHRLDRGRPPDPGPGGADGEAGRPSSWAASRRRSTCPTPLHRVAAGAVAGRRHDGRSGVRRRDPDARARRAQGRGARSGGRRLRRHEGRSAQRSGRHHGPAHQRRPAGAVRALRRAGRGARRQGRLRRGAAGRSRAGLLLRADGARPARQRQPGGPGGDLRPGLGVIGYEDVDDAVRIANDSIYGLSGQVYGADVAAADGGGPADPERSGERQHLACSAPTHRAGATSRADSGGSAASRASAPSRRSSTSASANCRHETRERGRAMASCRT